MHTGRFVYYKNVKNIFIKYLNRRNMASEQCPILYGDEISPPVRFVMMTASVLDFQMKFHRVDLFKSEQKQEWFTQINPLQKVPALDIGEAVLCDSHAIALYICDKSIHSKDIYPVEPLQRALVNQVLFFNSGTLFNIDSEIFSEYFKGNWPLDEELVSRWYRALDFLDKRLTINKWLTGDKLTLGDLCCGATVSSVVLLFPLLKKHSRIWGWLANLEKLPCYKINQQGIAILQSCLKV